MIVDFTINYALTRPPRTIRGIVSLKSAPSICFEKQEPPLEGCGDTDFGLPESWYLYWPTRKPDCGNFVFQGWHKNVNPKSDNIKQTMETVNRLLAVPHMWVVESKRATWVPAHGYRTRDRARLAAKYYTNMHKLTTRIRKYVRAKE
jgi:hypothetical protein